MKIKRKVSAGGVASVRVELELGEGEGSLVFSMARLATTQVMVLQQKITNFMFEMRKLDTGLQEVGFGVRMGFDRDPIDPGPYLALRADVASHMQSVQGLEDADTGAPITLEDLQAEKMIEDFLEVLGVDRLLELVNAWVEGHSLGARLKKKSSSPPVGVTASPAKGSTSPTPTSEGIAPTPRSETTSA